MSAIKYPPDAVEARVPPAYHWFEKYMDGTPISVANRDGMWRIVSHEYVPDGPDRLKARLILRPIA